MSLKVHGFPSTANQLASNLLHTGERWHATRHTISPRQVLNYNIREFPECTRFTTHYLSGTSLSSIGAVIFIVFGISRVFEFNIGRDAIQSGKLRSGTDGPAESTQWGYLAHKKVPPPTTALGP